VLIPAAAGRRLDRCRPIARGAEHESLALRPGQSTRYPKRSEPTSPSITATLGGQVRRVATKNKGGKRLSRLLAT